MGRCNFPSFRDGALAPDPESRDSGFDAEPVIGRRESADPLASPRNDEAYSAAFAVILGRYCTAGCGAVSRARPAPNSFSRSVPLA